MCERIEDRILIRLLIRRDHHYQCWAAKFGLYSALISYETHNCCRAFGSGAVTTCFNDFRPIEAEIRTPNLPYADVQRTAPPPRKNCIFNFVSTLKTSHSIKMKVLSILNSISALEFWHTYNIDNISHLQSFDNVVNMFKLKLWGLKVKTRFKNGYPKLLQPLFSTLEKV